MSAWRRRYPAVLVVAVLAFSLTGCGRQPSASTANRVIPATVTLPGSDDERVWGALFEGTLADTGMKYAEAHVYTNALLRADPSRTSRAEWLSSAANTLARWDSAAKAATRFQEVVSNLPEGSSVRPLVGSLGLIAAMRPPVIAQGDGEVEILSKPITQMVDEAPSGQRLKAAAGIFGTDIETAAERLQDLRQKVSAEQTQWAGIHGDLASASEAIATGSQIALFAGGLLTGGSEIALLGSAGKLKNLVNVVTTAFNGASLVFTAGESGANLSLWSKETGAAFAAAKEWKYFKAMSTLVSIKDLTKAFSDFRSLSGKAFSSGGKLSLDAVKKMAGDADVIDKIKENGIGNVQVTYDWGTWAWKYLTDNPEVKDLRVAPGDTSVAITPGKPLTMSEDGLGIRQISDGKFVLADTYIVTVEGSPPPAIVPPSESPPSPTPSEEKNAHDGTYTGSSGASSGVASATLSVRGGSVSGSGTYRETSGDQIFRIHLSLSGSVYNYDDGLLSGRISGSGGSGDSAVSVSGRFSGQVRGDTISLSYTASASNGRSASGRMTLTKG